MVRCVLYYIYLFNVLDMRHFHPFNMYASHFHADNRETNDSQSQDATRAASPSVANRFVAVQHSQRLLLMSEII